MRGGHGGSMIGGHGEGRIYTGSLSAGASLIPPVVIGSLQEVIVPAPFVAGFKHASKAWSITVADAVKFEVGDSRVRLHRLTFTTLFFVVGGTASINLEHRLYLGTNLGQGGEQAQLAVDANRTTREDGGGTFSTAGRPELPDGIEFQYRIYNPAQQSRTVQLDHMAFADDTTPV